jgi:hypothetical protein
LIRKWFAKFSKFKSCQLELIIIIAAMETVNRMEEEIQESDLLHFQKNQLMKSEQEDGPNLCAETILMSTALPKIAKFVNFTFQKMWISITGNKCINIVHPDSFFKYSQGRRNVFEYGEIIYF